MERQTLLSFSQHPYTDPYPEPGESTPNTFYSLKTKTSEPPRTFAFLAVLFGPDILPPPPPQKNPPCV